MRVYDLRCDYRTDPLGTDSPAPRLSWKLDAGDATRRGTRQTAYRVRAARSAEALARGGADLWDSGRVDSDASVGVAYAGPTLGSGERANWTVTVWDENGQEATAEAPAFWEAGLLDRADWKGEWIGGDLVGGPRTSVPCPYLRKTFTAGKPVTKARLYATALGLYECTLNGKRVGEDWLTPGWTDYNTRVQYQAYDVTDLVKDGANVWGTVLGDGWYCGSVEWRGRQRYGDKPRFLAQLVLTYQDGTTENVATDASWKTTYGPLVEADLLMGQSYDARREFAAGWDADADFDESAWKPVTVTPDPGIALSAMVGPPVRATEELSPVGPAVGNVWDLGQNLVGTVRVRVKGEAGATLRLRYAEVLKNGPKAELPGGGIYTDNLRSARQTDYYTLKGDPNGEEFEPRLTFHGFRYVEAAGYPGSVQVESVTGIVLHSDTPKTGDFECSDPLVNQLQKNIDWGQRGNYVDIPTDCPQRDERLGWTGDAQAFVRAAAFNRDIAGFFHKWLRDLRDSQGEKGEIPPVIPNTGVVGGDGGPAWADAAVICPWTVYLTYGDRAALEENYEAMKRFVGFWGETARDHIRCYEGYKGFSGFGDWLALDGSGKTDGGTPKELIGTAFYAYSSDLVSRAAAALGREDDARHYRQLFETVRDAFQARFVTSAGLVYPGTQTAHVLALHFDLLKPEQRQPAVDALVRDIERRGNKLSTGFVGSPYLPHVLTAASRTDVAYKLLFQKNWPSYLYAVTQGATTIWERWDGWTHDKGFQDVGMNSFNHYAYGAIGDWLYQVVAGIDIDPANPGYKHLVLRPRPGGGLTHAKATLDSVYGPIKSEWHAPESGGLTWEVTVPPNTTATAYVPSAEGTSVSEGDGPADNATGVTFTRREDGAAVYELQPGRYRFQVA